MSEHEHEIQVEYDGRHLINCTCSCGVWIALFNPTNERLVLEVREMFRQHKAEA